MGGVTSVGLQDVENLQGGVVTPARVNCYGNSCARVCVCVCVCVVCLCSFSLIPRLLCMDKNSGNNYFKASVVHMRDV